MITDELVFIGLSLSSSWGNGHATTYRALLRGLAATGQKVLFLERDLPWYAANRDLQDPDFCELSFYQSPDQLLHMFGPRIAKAPSGINRSVWAVARPDRVVPLAVKFGAENVQRGHFLFQHDDALGIEIGIEFATH